MAIVHESAIPPLAPPEEFPQLFAGRHKSDCRAPPSSNVPSSSPSDEGLVVQSDSCSYRPTIATTTPPFTQLSAANVAPTCNRCYQTVVKWQTGLLHGAALFDDAQEEVAFEALRENGARLFGCCPEDIAGGSSCSELLGSLAWGVMERVYGGTPSSTSRTRDQRPAALIEHGMLDAPPRATKLNIVGTKSCFPSTFYCWHRVAEHFGAEIRLVDHDPESYVTAEEDVLAAIDANTVVVALSHVEFTSGQCYDLEKIARVLAEKTENASQGRGYLVVDGTQSVGLGGTVFSHDPEMIPVPQFFPKVAVSMGGESGIGQGQTAWQLWRLACRMLSLLGQSDIFRIVRGCASVFFRFRVG